MRIRETIVAAGFLSTVAAATLVPREAAAQVPPVPPTVLHDSGWGTVSNVTMVVGAATVFLMPRVYFNDPEATVGWKGRWHFSVFAPAMTMTAATLLVDGPIKGAIQSTRPGCTADATTLAFPGSGCETYGGPSTQSYASWGATGAGLGIFLVDTIKYSDWRFSVPSFVGNVGLPLTLSVLTSVSRAVNPGNTTAFESGGQVVAGAATGLLTGVLVGVAYSALQRPSCGYGNSIFCW